MNHEIHFFTGKGGVGKSTVAAAFALKAARSGRKTLLVELGHTSYYQDFFGPQVLGGKSVGYEPIKVDQNLDLALWSGNSCLKEYVLYFLKVESIYKLFFENSVSKALINTAPSLQELAILGKITSHPRKVGPPLPYDSIVVDGHATGHFLALLRGPQGMAKAVRFGPMGEQTRGIIRVLEDPKICHYHVVSIPEELPVEEGLELSQGIEALVGMKPQQVLNRVLPELPSTQIDSPFVTHINKVKAQETKAKEEFKKREFITHTLSENFQTDSLEKIKELANEY